MELLACIAVFHVSATVGFLRHLEYLTTTADERKTSSRLQSFHKWGVLGSSMLLSRESGTQLSSGNLPSSGHKKSKTQRTFTFITSLLRLLYYLWHYYWLHAPPLFLINCSFFFVCFCIHTSSVAPPFQSLLPCNVTLNLLIFFRLLLK